MILVGRYSGLVSSINPDTEYGVTAEDARIREYDDVPFLDCTNTTARYIERLPEIVGVLKWIVDPQRGERSIEQEIQAIITYAEGKQDE